MKTGSNPIFFIRQTDVSRELLIPSSIVRFLVRFFRVVDGGRAKSEIKQQKKGGRERERESLTRLPSILLDQSSFPCLRLIYRGAIDLPDPPPSFTWISREEIVSRSIYSIYSRDKRTRGERWWIMRRNPAEGGKLECFN